MKKCLICGSDKVLARNLCSKHYQRDSRRRAASESLDSEKEDQRIRVIVGEAVADAITRLVKSGILFGGNDCSCKDKRKIISKEFTNSPLPPHEEWRNKNNEPVILGKEVPEPCLVFARWMVGRGFARVDSIPLPVKDPLNNKDVYWYDREWPSARNRYIKSGGKVKFESGFYNPSIDKLDYEDLELFDKVGSWD